jgi:uncharacterized protein YcgI (DUF1989 family)
VVSPIARGTLHGHPIGISVNVSARELGHLPAREGRGVSVRGGDRVLMIDRQDGQVADVFAFALDDPSEYHSAGDTRVNVHRRFPA